MQVNAQDLLEIFEEVGVLVDIKSLKFDIALRDQGIDSLDMANIFLNIQEKYGVNVSLEETIKLDTINKIVEYLTRH